MNPARDVVLRGEVYLADLDPVRGSEQAGTRPVIIVSRNSTNNGSTILAVPCTTYKGQRIYMVRVLIHIPDGGLDRDSVAKCDQVRVLAQERLTRKLGALRASTMQEIDRALLIMLDLPMP